MSITKLDTLTDTIPTIIEKAHLTSQFDAVMAGLSWRIRKADHKGSTVNVPYFGEVEAQELTDGTDMLNSETMADTNVPITLAERGAKIILTDNLMEDDAEMVTNLAGVVLGHAMEKIRDTDLIEQMDDASSSLIGSGSPLTMGGIAAAKATLAGNITANGGPAPNPYVCVLHPFQTLDLVDVITPVLPAAGTTNVTGTSFTDDILKNYTIGRLFGMPIVEDGNIPFESNGTDKKGGVFSMAQNPGSIILATARDWTVVPERDESLRGTELNCVGRYGVGEYLAGWIVELLTDAAAPA